MTFADVREKVVNLLEAVDGIGAVHDFIRHSTTWEEIFSRHVKDGKINDWEITRASFVEDLDTVSGAVGVEPCFQDLHLVQIFAYFGHNDANKTEKTFQDLLDRVVLKFRTDNLLDGILLLPRQMQIPSITHRMFGGVLVHFAELNFEAIERVGG